MYCKKIYLILMTSVLMTACSAHHHHPHSHWHSAVTEPVPVSDLQDYDHYPESVKKLIANATVLSKAHLTYLYGSADPKNHGMDCSGTVHYLLKNLNVQNVPRDSRGMYAWAKQKGKLYAVHAHSLDSSDFSNLKPGDLLFWSGTYAGKGRHDISHVMIYLGHNSKNEALIFGSSNGRNYQGRSLWGVSVFNFDLPNQYNAGKFVGYSCIPSLTCQEMASG